MTVTAPPTLGEHTHGHHDLPLLEPGSGLAPSCALTPTPADQGSAMREVTLLRLRALLARANGDDTVYRDYRDHYRAMARPRLD